MQRRMSDSKREEVAGGWRNLHNEELQNLYSSQNMMRVIRSRRVRGRIASVRMEDKHDTESMLGIWRWGEGRSSNHAPRDDL
jgi:hypothetical protein